MATIQDTLAQRQKEMAGKISGLYDKQYDAKAAELKTAYDKNVSDLQAQQQKIAPQYQQQANAMAAQYERNRRNANLQAMNNGMATGTAVQQQNALNNKFQQNYAGLRAQEAAAQTEAGQKLVNLGAEYQNQLAAARADALNKSAAAQVEDYGKQNDWYDEQAKILAQYGDFSAYEKLYGKEAADYMKKIWKIQHPTLAV